MVAAKVAPLPVGANQHAAIAAPSQTEASKMLNASQDSIQRAKRILDAGNEELQHALENGAIPVSRAVTLVDTSLDFQRAVVDKVKAGAKPTEAIRQVKKESLPEVTLPSSKYRVLYADPPWKYGDERAAGRL